MSRRTFQYSADRTTALSTAINTFRRKFENRSLPFLLLVRSDIEFAGRRPSRAARSLLLLNASTPPRRQISDLPRRETAARKLSRCCYGACAYLPLFTENVSIFFFRKSDIQRVFASRIFTGHVRRTRQTRVPNNLIHFLGIFDRTRAYKSEMSRGRQRLGGRRRRGSCARFISEK